jgi:hypothetical protein
VEVPQDSHREPDIPDVVIPPPLPETTPTNAESSNASPASETTTTESTSLEPASTDPVSTNADVARVNPTPEKSYPKHNHVPVVRYEPSWT